MPQVRRASPSTLKALAVARFLRLRKNSVLPPSCLRARVHPCHKCCICNTALAAEVRFWVRPRLFPQPMKARHMAFVGANTKSRPKSHFLKTLAFLMDDYTSCSGRRQDRLARAEGPFHTSLGPKAQVTSPPQIQGLNRLRKNSVLLPSCLRARVHPCRKCRRGWSLKRTFCTIAPWAVRQ